MTVASNLSKTTQPKPACHGIPDGTPANTKNKKALNNQGFWRYALQKLRTKSWMGNSRSLRASSMGVPR